MTFTLPCMLQEGIMSQGIEMELAAIEAEVRGVRSNFANCAFNATDGCNLLSRMCRWGTWSE